MKRGGCHQVEGYIAFRRRDRGGGLSRGVSRSGDWLLLRLGLRSRVWGRSGCMSRFLWSGGCRGGCVRGGSRVGFGGRGRRLGGSASSRWFFVS